MQVFCNIRWGPSFPAPKGAQPLPNFAHVYCGQMAGWIKMPLGTEVGLNPGDTVRCRPNFPQFLGHVYCGETAARIRMPVGMEVGLGQATLCQMGTHLPPKGHSP